MHMKRMLKNKFILCLCLGILAGNAFGIRSKFINNSILVIGNSNEKDNLKNCDKETWENLIKTQGFIEAINEFGIGTIETTNELLPLDQIKPKHILNWRNGKIFDQTQKTIRDIEPTDIVNGCKSKIDSDCLSDIKKINTIDGSKEKFVDVETVVCGHNVTFRFLIATPGEKYKLRNINIK